MLTALDRDRALCEQAARDLAGPLEVLALDVNQPDDFNCLTEDLRQRWGRLDAPCTPSPSHRATRSPATS